MVWTTRVSNPVCSPHFRASASITGQQTAFATGVLPDIYAFHRYTWNSICLSCIQEAQFQKPLTRLSRAISLLTHAPAYTPFTPSESGQRLHPPYYRGCWHGVSRCLLWRYRQARQNRAIRPSLQEFTIQGPSSSTRRCCVRLSPIAQYSSLLPPIGVWAVSQSQCG